LALEDRTVPAGILDSGFETPVLTAGTFQYGPAGAPWIFSSGAGISTNNSGFTSGNPPAPEGNQVALLQRQATITQNVTFDAGTYTISFSAAQRGNVPSAQTFQVLIDNTVVGTFNSLTGTAYSTLTTSSFTATAGVHSLQFRGTNLRGTDNTVFLDRVTLNLQDTGLVDSGFELPTLNPNTFQYHPSGTPWTFSNSAGVAANNSPFTASNPVAPQGNQVAFLQQVSTMSQSVNFTAGTYALSFSAAQRGGAVNAQTFQVLVDSTVLGTFTTLTSTTYVTLSTSPFTVTNGAHTILFRGTNSNGGDNTVFIDQVLIARQSTTLIDGGFESPALTAGTFQYHPSGSAWTFTPLSGISTNGSPFTSGGPNAPQGNQVAVIQGLSSVSQSVQLNAGLYVISFAAVQRTNLASAQTLRVLIDSTVIGTFNNISGPTYATLVTSSFQVSSGSHTITFQGTNLRGGDNTAFIDQVVLTAQSFGFNDSGFETPALNTNSFAYAPSGSPWTFSGGAGLATNGSGFTSGNSLAPQGNQVLFVQQVSNASQSITLPTGSFTISFFAAQRGNLSSRQTLQVLVDGNVVGTFNSLTNTAYLAQTTGSFNVTAGTHLITFQGTNLNGGDNTLFLDQASITQGSVGPNDPGFELPGLAPGTFMYTPSGSPWTFTGTAGISSNGSSFTSGNPNAPQGNQVAILQQTGSISQAIPIAAGNYTISFFAAQRAPSNRQTFQVLVDNVVVDTFSNFTATTYVVLTTPSFSLADGIHTIKFLGTNTNGGDNTVFLDQVVLNMM
jgi:hypothetical protein